MQRSLSCTHASSCLCSFRSPCSPHLCDVSLSVMRSNAAVRLQDSLCLLLTIALLAVSAVRADETARLSRRPLRQRRTEIHQRPAGADGLRARPRKSAARRPSSRPTWSRQLADYPRQLLEQSEPQGPLAEVPGNEQAAGAPDFRPTIAPSCGRSPSSRASTATWASWPTRWPTSIAAASPARR